LIQVYKKVYSKKKVEELVLKKVDLNQEHMIIFYFIKEKRKLKVDEVQK